MNALERRIVFGRRFLALAGLFFVSITGAWAVESGRKDTSSRDALLEIQRELLELDQQFELIRQDLFFPKDAEVLFYLRNQIIDAFPLAAVEIAIDGRGVYQHPYSDTERIAFKFSNLQPLHRLELPAGSHEIVLKFQLREDRRFKKKSNANATVNTREYRFDLNKEDLPKFVELEVSIDENRDDLAVKEKIW